MKKHALSLGTIAIAAAGASAGFTQTSATLNDNSSLIAGFAAANSISASNVVVNSIAGVSGGDTMHFHSAASASAPNGDFTVSVSASDSLNFFLGDVSGLGSNWFDGGVNTIPGAGTSVLGFGNTESHTNSNEVVMAFAPGVTAFGFNFDDIEVSTMTISWGSGGSESILINSVEGFISLIADAGDTITSITLTQNSPSANDGFSFYGFQTLQAVPVPTAAIAGLGLLGGLGAMRRIKRR